MKRVVLACFLLTSLIASAQLTKIIIPAGTPEDQAIQAITNENDIAKKLGMLQEFVQKFASNPQAVAYGNWQISQLYLTQGDSAKALDYGQKALAVQPDNLDILVAVAGVAQQLKENDKVVEYALAGGKAFNGIAKQPKPADISDEDFANRIKQDQDSARPGYEYLEAAGLNAIVAEQNAKKRMAYIEGYIAAFPGSRFQDQIMQLAVYTLSQENDPARLVSFSEKALAANPNSLGMLAMLASAFAESPNSTYLARSEEYAHKAIQLAKADEAGADKQTRIWAGLAHSALGFALLKQDKNLPAIAELKSASALLKEDPQSYSTALYRLGFAYAKANKVAEARSVLTEAVAIPGPAQEPARELLNKVNAAGTRHK